MENNYHPIIIVVAYNRVHTLQRILNSLSSSVCPDDAELIISIDNNGKNEDVAALAEQYSWKYGEKQVIYHKEHLGMQKHFDFCGNLSYKYGSVILLEDDMVVSPYFYTFAQESLNYYQNSEDIAGITLHNLPYTEAAKLPFIPISDDADVYFSQVPCTLSWAYSVEQWDSFKKWFNLNPDLSEIHGLPMVAREYWSKGSWKKYLYGYMVVKNKYFVYPQVSYSSNFNDLGTHMAGNNYMGQVGMQMVQKEIKFKSLEESVAVYDAYSEILPDRLNRLNNVLSEYDYEVDLYGQKESFTKEYVLTSKNCIKKIKGFERAMKPQELNIVYNIPGDDFGFAKTEDVNFSLETVKGVIFRTMPISDYIDIYSYYFTNVFDTNKLIQILKLRIITKTRKLFGGNTKS